MARLQYKDGCLSCNECGQLYEPVAADGTPAACPCGNAENLDAIQRLVEFYNDGPDGRNEEPDAE